jgi:hypothetical protein
MNPHRFASVLGLLVLLAGFTACSGSVQQHLDTLDLLIAQSDSVSLELSAIDSVKVDELFLTSSELKKKFKTYVKNDTLELDFARELNAFLLANKQLKELNSEKIACSMANIDARKRLQKLKTDIAGGSGDRSGYTEYVGAETKEMSAIRNHSSDLKRRFETADSVIEQFQPDIERFISQFVSPSQRP